MRREFNPNLEIMEIAVARLGAMAEEMVFLGGCATGLLITDAVAPAIRATKDVDVIVEVASLIEYHRLSKRLRELGFSEDQSPDAPICRWRAGEILLDVMPTHPEILGFGNEWYQPAFDAACGEHYLRATRYALSLHPTSWRPSLQLLTAGGKVTI